MNELIDGYKTLNEIATVISQSLDLNEVLCSALDEVLEATNLEVGGIYLLNEQTQMLLGPVCYADQPKSPVHAFGSDRIGHRRWRAGWQQR